MILFRCETFYQLLSIINLKLNVKQDIPADLVLTRSCDFTDVIPKIMEMNIFDNIIQANDDWKNSVAINELAKGKKADITANPNKYLLNEEWMTKEYDEFYMPTFTSSYHYLVYYNFYYQFGKVPKVVLYEDGTDTYSRNDKDVITQRSGICLDLKSFPSYIRFENNVKAIYVYEPRLCKNKSKFRCLPIPKIPEETLDVLKEIFGYESLPKEKFIFFSEPFRDEFVNNNEYELLDYIAGKIGKENIIVKVHPRCTLEQFSAKGYKVMQTTNIPWEMMASDKEVMKKVLIAVSSTTLFSPKFLFDYKINSVMLKKLVTKNRSFATLKEFDGLLETFEKRLNEDERTLFIPQHIDELDYAIEYYEMIQETSYEKSSIN